MRNLDFLAVGVRWLGWLIRRKLEVNRIRCEFGDVATELFPLEPTQFE